MELNYIAFVHSLIDQELGHMISDNTQKTGPVVQFMDLLSIPHTKYTNSVAFGV